MIICGDPNREKYETIVHFNEFVDINWISQNDVVLMFKNCCDIVYIVKWFEFVADYVHIHRNSQDTKKRIMIDLTPLNSDVLYQVCSFIDCIQFECSVLRLKESQWQFGE